MNKIEELLKEEDKVEEANGVVRASADTVDEINKKMKSGRISPELASSQTAAELYKALDAMFKADPVRAAQALMQSFKDAYMRGATTGFVVGALLAFVTAYMLS